MERYPYQGSDGVDVVGRAWDSWRCELATKEGGNHNDDDYDHNHDDNDKERDAFIVDKDKGAAWCCAWVWGVFSCIAARDCLVYREE